MACNIYIERPIKNNYCRLCNKEYKTEKSKECRFNLFKKKEGNVSLAERLAAVDLIIIQEKALSDTICRGCETKIKKIEEGKRIKQTLIGVKRKSTDDCSPTIIKQTRQQPSRPTHSSGKKVTNISPNRFVSSVHIFKVEFCILGKRFVPPHVSPLGLLKGNIHYISF
jgi:hypothetical protein